MQIQTSCNICNSNKISLKFIKEGINFVKCEKCGFVFVYPTPSIKTQQEYYDKEYKSGLYKLVGDTENLRKKLNQRRFSEISKYSPKGNLLDIGCGAGFFLDAAAEQGLSVYGVELSTEAASKTRQRHKNIFNGPLENAKYQDSFFDVVAIFDLIEHVLDPDITIKEIHRIVKPGGLIIFTTPDISSWHARIMGKYWYQINPHQHLFYFSPHTMKKILEKNGFTVVEIKKNYKIFTIDVILKMAEFYYPSFFKILSFFKSFLSGNSLQKERMFYFGEIFAVGKKNA